MSSQLRIARIEAWGLEVAKRAAQGERTEDSRVELKREWPDPASAARQIAAHANAAFGADLLWLIGLDEKVGVIGADATEFANWWPQVSSHFDGVAPSVIDVNVPTEGKAIACMLIDTSRSPFVVKNPKYGQKGGGAVELEVPWREGAKTRTARRSDLVRLLVPALSRPEVEVIQGFGAVTEIDPWPSQKGQEVNLWFQITCYMYPANDLRVCIPFHKCSCSISDWNFTDKRYDGLNLKLHEPEKPQPYQEERRGTASMTSTSSELFADGPGMFSIRASARLSSESPELRWLAVADLRMAVHLPVINCDLPIEFEIPFYRRVPVANNLHAWEAGALKA